MLEGWKAWALPVVASVLLIAFFGYRCSKADHDTASAHTRAAKAAPTKTRREQIEHAIADAGATAPPLPDGYRDTIAAALAPLVARCRQSRPDDAAIALAIHVEVAAAETIGGLVRTIETRGTVDAPASAGLVACIEEGSRALALPDASATGAASYDLEVRP